MNPSKTQPANTNPDESAISAIPLRMMEAWNQGSAERFAAPFTENADFIAFEGTHLQGRAEIIAFHQQIFATVVKGSRLVEAAAKFVHFLTPQLAVLHATVRVILPGETAPSPSRDSMQLFVVRKHAGEWRAEAMLNARRLTLERQSLLDDFDALPEAAQRQVTDLLASLKQCNQAQSGR